MTDFRPDFRPSKRARAGPPEEVDEPTDEPTLAGTTLAGKLPALASGAADGGGAERAWRGEWTFVQLADTQLGMFRAAGGWREEIAMAERAVAAVNALAPRPRFVVVCGDLTDAMPCGPRAAPARCEAQRADFARVFARVDPAIATVCVCGNHDVGNRPTAASLAEYRTWFGCDRAAFWMGGCRCVVINSALYAAREDHWWLPSARERATAPAVDGGAAAADAALAADRAFARAAADEQDAWLDSELSAMRALGEAGNGDDDADAPASPLASPPVHLIAFAHHPPFLFAPDEPKGYFNLEPAVREPLLAKVSRPSVPLARDTTLTRALPTQLKRANVSKLFCGHFHRNAGGYDGGLEVVVTSAAGCVLSFAESALGESAAARQTALGLEGFDWEQRRCDGAASGLRVVTVTSEAVNHRFFTMDQIEAHVANAHAA